MIKRRITDKNAALCAERFDACQSFFDEGAADTASLSVWFDRYRAKTVPSRLTANRDR